MQINRTIISIENKRNRVQCVFLIIAVDQSNCQENAHLMHIDWNVISIIHK